jgi:hypothetical protein
MRSVTVDDLSGADHAEDDTMQAPSDSTRRRVATVGIAGAALALSAAAGVPVMADSSGSHSSHSSQSSGSSQGSGGHGASENGSAGSSDTSGHNPPGNNGTVFIHDVAGDERPHNVPHVSCTFYVDLFGFDAGQTVTVSFAGQAPTGKDTALGGTWTGVVSDDDAGGAGNDFDKELAYTADDLGVTSLGAPAHQGYHVKMTVATNEPGGKKSKVFWIEPCTAPTVVGGTTGGATVRGLRATKTTTTKKTTTKTTSTVRPGTTTVLGERFTRPAAPTSVAGSSTALPFTGTEIGLFTVAGLCALGTGAALVAVTRRRPYQPAQRS